MSRTTLSMIAASLLVSAAPSNANDSQPSRSLNDTVSSLQDEGFTGQVVLGDASSVVFDRTIGMAEQAPIWIWGSVSKQVTAALVMTEVDRGTLALDDTVGTKLPEFRDAQGRRATLRQLLQHTSGLANPNTGAAEGQAPSFYLRSGEGVGGMSDALGLCAGAPASEPGRFSYNNCDTIVAGAVLERATGRSFSQLLAERVTTPLGMKTVRLARSGERLSVGASQGSAAPINIATYGPSAAIVGSARDLMLFNQALMNGRIISAASTSKMWAGDPKLGYAALGAWSFSTSLRGCEAPVRLIERRGSVDGVQARSITAPDLKRTVVVFTPHAESKFDFGEIWQAQGPSYELASAAFCHEKLS